MDVEGPKAQRQMWPFMWRTSVFSVSAVKACSEMCVNAKVGVRYVVSALTELLAFQQICKNKILFNLLLWGPLIPKC